MPSKTLPTPDQPAVRVVMVAFDGISPFHLAVPCVVFGDRHPSVAPFEFRVCAADSRLRTTVGFELRVDRGLAALRQADVVIVPSWRDPAETPPEALTQALRAAHTRGTRLVGLCLGAYPLAATGLLDGRRATAHWSVADDFAQRFAAVQVDREVLYVDEGDVVTSAGTAAGMDCCLHILRQLRGAEAANRAARHLVIAPHRAGGQAQRLAQAQRLLEQSELSIDAVAEAVGMGTAAALRQQFRRQVGVPPTAWRKRFAHSAGD